MRATKNYGLGKRMKKDTFFEKMDNLGIALTYDDVKLRPGHSSVHPTQVRTDSLFSRNVPLKIPLVSAAMDTVTEYKMAREIAKHGGLGIIHRKLSPKEQASQVSRVKYYLNGLIDKPRCVRNDQTIEQILNMRAERDYEFHTFPVINSEGKLVGMLTENDFDFNENPLMTAQEVMTSELITAPAGTTLTQAYEYMKKHKKKSLPLVGLDGTIVGLYVWSDIKRIRSDNGTMHNIDQNGQLRVGAAVGDGDDAFSRLEYLIPKKVDVVVIDTAHADTDSVINTLKEIKRCYPSLDVVVGNVSEPESAYRLAESGADGVKVGQGPGSICTTRIIAGIGCPQVTAVYECSTAVKDFDIPVCADGGLRYSGDIPVAIGAGAHSVMMGSMFAGTKEAPGKLIRLDGRRFKQYRGMGSLGAMKESQASRDRYRQGNEKLVPEGVEGVVPYKGPVSDIISMYVGGLQAGMGYVGAANIHELQEKADFRRQSNAGIVESHSHDIKITEEAPNYSCRKK